MALLLTAAVVTPAGAVVSPAVAAALSVTGAVPTSSPVTADALPTTQIDGVAWSQVVAGNTVFVGGRFSTARPAGAAPGTDTVGRRNLLSYDITNGVLTSFDPGLNGQVRVLALSPDGGTLYAGGDFTRAAGDESSRIVAFDTATGTRKGDFEPRLNGSVRAIVATDTTVYVGGAFTSANGKSRPRLAAFTAKHGVLLGWNPEADAVVTSMLLSPNGRRVVVGGSFAHLGGIDAYGMGLVGVSSGNGYPWAANKVIRDAGTNGAITSLSTDGKLVYGTGFDFYSKGANFEGIFAADPETGDVRWIEDCRGDSYDAYPYGNVIFVASHSHDCSTLGGFPDVVDVGHRATAFTIQATQTLTATTADPENYQSFAGYAAPTLLNWFPDLAPGTFTGQSQAAWNVAGNGDYVVYAGEFPTVNGVGQQSLVRFPARALSPHLSGPVIPAVDLLPAVTRTPDGYVDVSFPANWDRDDPTLNYQLLRDGVLVTSELIDSRFWYRPTVTLRDTAPPPGMTYTYTVVSHDLDLNWVVTNPILVSTP